MTIMSNKDSEEVKKQMEKKEKINGKIIKVHPSGWGFIISEDVKFVKFFFHWTGLITETKNFKDLEVGMKVKFIPLNLDEREPAKEPVDGERKRGPRAIKIEVI